jgi:hypothetical protein
MAMGEEDIGVSDAGHCTVNALNVDDPYCYKQHVLAKLVRINMLTGDIDDDGATDSSTPTPDTSEMSGVATLRARSLLGLTLLLLTFV